MAQRHVQRRQVVADLVTFDRQFGGVSDGMLKHAATGNLTVEELADYEDCHGLTSGLLVVSGPYVDRSFTTDARIALEVDPSLDDRGRFMALRSYDRWSRR